MIEPYHSKALTNLKKARGQMDRLVKMIEEGQYCIDIAQQVNAAMGLLKKINAYLLESHLTTCAGKQLSQKDAKKKTEFIRELTRTFSVTNR